MAGAGRSPRERYREQVRDEIKAHAWTQVATDGAAALSLNAIARQMGISGPALYRYFRNRDELITDLVMDAYRDLRDACLAAVAPGGPPQDRLAAVAAAMRHWALAAPHRYLLIYGTPVPGYQAPPEAAVIAASIMAILLDAFTDMGPARGPVAGAAAALDDHLVTHRQWTAGRPAQGTAPRRALTFWTRLHGVVSLEVAGHFGGLDFDPALLYAAEADAAIGAP
jgi:AcrR family transcriptional regulator